MKMPPRKIVGDGKKEMVIISKDDPIYKEKRNKNNDAVKKSRMKTKVKSEETMKKVAILKQENESLEERIQLLSKELTFLKDIFLAHAQKTHGVEETHLGLGHLLKEVDEAVMEMWSFIYILNAFLLWILLDIHVSVKFFSLK